MLRFSKSEHLGFGGIVSFSIFLALLLSLFLAASIQAACVQPPSGMVSWWPSDGDANDIVGTNNGTLVNGATFASGMVGQSFSFDGADDYVQVPDSASLDLTAQITIDAWVYPTVQGRRVVDKITAGGSDGYLLDTWPGNVRFIVGNIGVVGSTPLSTGVWTHIAGTYDGSQLRVYVNGVLDGSVNTNIAIPTNNLPLRIGADQNGSNLFNGLIDEVEIFGRGLSAAEIQSIYNTGSDGKCKSTPPPVCSFTMNVPTSPSNIGTFTPGIFMSYDPMVARPFGLEEAGDILTGRLWLPCWRNGNADIYLVLDAPAYGGKFMLSELHQWLSFPANIQPWQTYTDDDVYAALFSLQKSGILPGNYKLDVIVVPSGTAASTIDQIVSGAAAAPYYKWSFTETLP